MGLTIHYSLKSKLTDDKQVQQSVHQMRQLALDLPFEKAGEVVDIKGKQCDTEARRTELQNGNEKNESFFWLLIKPGRVSVASGTSTSAARSIPLALSLSTLGPAW